MSKPKRQPKAEASRLFETQGIKREAMPVGIPEPDRTPYFDVLLKAYGDGLDILPDGINVISRRTIIDNLIGGTERVDDQLVRGSLAERINRALEAAERRGKPSVRG